MSEFCVGQRWISNTDANLGLGIVAEVSDRRVMLSFPAAGEQRVYATRNAPLTRIFYKVGDHIHDMDERQLLILTVHEANQLYFYEVEDEQGEISILPELELDCHVRFNSPHERLLSGQIDPLKFFELRYDTSQYWHHYQQSPAIGLLGPRVQLLPHQLYIAQQVGSRIHPRVLLADEVGLGKTIEAGLIIHRQLTTGMASRVLIVVPDSLLHQWLVEMLRRFNLAFSVLDEGMAQASDEQGRNPFESSQLILCTLSFLLEKEERQSQALSCDWDMLVVDEAHHLEWSQEKVSPAYQLVEYLAAIAHGVLLLTATPEQLGLESHFARLRLLDPDRYFEFDAFVAEQEQYQPVNHLVKEIMRSDDLPVALQNFIGDTERTQIENLIANQQIDEAKEYAINALLDRHGTGRVLFRNTRAAIKGFPERVLHSYPLPFDAEDHIDAPINDWLRIENIYGQQWLEKDARVTWLIDLLKQHKREKFLLICANAETAIALEEYLILRQGVRACAFHEGMSLLNRDKAAAYFADTENAAQILVCSEIGSEGRNFQFARHIVLFDLPLNPDLLEQRIGRLDRIGQQNAIQIHVPYYENTAQETLLHWYHQGLNAFEQTCAIGRDVFERFNDQLMRCLEEQDSEQVEQLISESRAYADNLRELLQKGRDQLLEMNSCRPQQAEEIIQHIHDTENRLLLEDFVEQFADQLGVYVEPHSDDAIIMHPSEHMHAGNLPGLSDDGVTATYSREMALSRDDMAFLTWENPIVQGAMHMILDTNHGNSAIATIKIKALKPGTLLLEAFYNVACMAPKQLQVGRFLPASSIRTLVSLEGQDLSAVISHKKLSSMLDRIPMATAQALISQAKDPVEQLVAHAEKVANQQLPIVIAEANERMQAFQQAETHRLKALAEVNPAIRQEEIDYLNDVTEALGESLSQADLQLDAVRLIIAV